MKSTTTSEKAFTPHWRGDLRLLPSAVVAWAAAATAIHGTAAAATAGGIAAAAAGLLLTVAVFSVRSGRKPAGRTLWTQALAPAAALALVLLAAGGSLARAEAGPVQEAVLSEIPFTAILRISGEPSAIGPGSFGGGERFLVDATILGGVHRGTTFTAHTPVVVLGAEPWAHVGTGDTVRVVGTARPPDRVGRAAAIFFPATTPEIDRAGGWLAGTDDLRERFRDLADNDPRDGGLLPGMALGDRTSLQPGLEEAMRVTGLAHLTAVSGANCSYVLAFAFLGLRCARVKRLPAATGAVIALIAFVMLVRPEPSVLRAAVMGAIGVAAVLSGRGRVSLTLLLVSIIILLTVDPWLSVSFAFTLSVAATLGLVTAGPMIVAVLQAAVPRFAAQLLAIPFTAQLFCTPILVLIEPSLPVYSLLANVLAAPAVPAITLLGMVAVLGLLVTPVLAQPLIWAAQWGTRWVSGIAEVLADAPGASVPWAPGPAGASAAALLSLALLTLLFHSHRLADWRARRTGTGPDPNRTLRASARFGGARGRPLALALVVLLAVGLTAGAVVALRAISPPPPGWVMAMCNVGQGDGMVISTSPGHALVVDAGPDPEAMDRCLDVLEVDVLDAVVITHLHDDHYGGIAGALRGRTVTSLYYSSGEDGPPAAVTDAAAAAGVEVERLDDSTILDVPTVQVDVLWPPAELRAPEENNASAVLRVVVPSPDRPLTVLLTGDLEEDAAALLLSAHPSLRDGGVDILKVAHHGARNGGTGVLEAVDPSLALISVGEDNDYGHPHPAIIDALRRRGISTARTDELGSFTIDTDGDTVSVREIP